jgi:hypothetical protein
MTHSALRRQHDLLAEHRQPDVNEPDQSTRLAVVHSPYRERRPSEVQDACSLYLLGRQARNYDAGAVIGGVGLFVSYPKHHQCSMARVDTVPNLLCDCA